MRRITNIFIASGIAITVLLCLALYAYNWLDNLAFSVEQGGLLSYAENDPVPPGANSPSKPGASRTYNKPTGSASNPTIFPSPTNGLSSVPNEAEIASAAQQKTSVPIDKGDFASTLLLLTKRLDVDELGQLYTISTKAAPTTDDKKTIRNILRNKLTDQEILQLQATGMKYGKNLTWLN